MSDTRPLIVQSDHTILLEVHNDLYHDARDEISRFAELEKSPEHFHTYRITPLSIWNAAAAGLDGDAMVEADKSRWAARLRQRFATIKRRLRVLAEQEGLV